MPWGLLKYGFSKKYPARQDIPPNKELKNSYDVIIIGGGGHGAAIAYHLARYHGITNVAVLDKGYIGGGNTARNTAVIRSNYITPESVDFYKESVELYKQLSNELGYNMLYSQRGQLTLAHSDASMRTFRLRAEVNKQCGVRSEMVDREQIRELVPCLNLDKNARYPIIGGLWHKDGGTARHDSVAWGYAMRASQLGVEFHQRTEVTDIKQSNGRVTGVVTNRGTVNCKDVVQAVAGMSTIVAKMAGIQLPIRTFPLQAMVTQPLKPFVDPLVSSAALHCYISQTARGEIVIGGGSDPYELYSTRSSLDLKEGLIGHLLEMFPFLSEVKLLRQWTGMTDMTPDYSPIMGETPLQNYWIDGGWGTWGFKATPIAGKRMAETVARGRAPDQIRPFSLSRFRTYHLSNEAGATAASH
ncbi:sarcosine oxidase subunit beta [Methylohalomonas lacus]|uniref:Sarcosine oxidase subunit beta n=1 Tax=Methylohalomonas lacus TaxID=398773 RepID=A0AAE3HK54_9GAMM|nr:FAD-dependent oxidoreductase [Methylohalomonas lacus]MCS3903831.1 sarcosine oxidase subunit beta [Methylohalomonas lacus]